MKAETRVIGIDDGGTRLRRRVVIGVIFRGHLWLDGVVTCLIDVAASSLERKLASMVTKSKFYKELRFAMLHGAMLSSIGSIGLIEFNAITELPTIAILQGSQVAKVGRTLGKVRGADHVRLRSGVWALCIGLTTKDAAEVLRITSARGVVPEPVRVAGLIASTVNSPKRLN